MDLRTNNDFFPSFGSLADLSLLSETELVLCAVRVVLLHLIQMNLKFQDNLKTVYLSNSVRFSTLEL